MVETIQIQKINRWSLNEYEGVLSITLRGESFDVYALIPEGDKGWANLQIGETKKAELRLERSTHPPKILSAEQNKSITQIDTSIYEITGLVLSIPEVQGLPLGDILVVDVGFPLLVDLDLYKPALDRFKVGDWGTVYGQLKVDFDISEPFV